MYEYKGKILRAVDGDTAEIQFDLGFHVYTIQRVRLARINAPERGQPGATEATQYLSQFQDKEVTVRTSKSDKYGRYIAELITDKGNVSDLMLQEHLAEEYKG